jgi:DNA mismatch repair protein MutS2
MTETTQQPDRGLVEALGWDELLAKLAALCHTVRGQERVAALPLLAEPAAVQAELDLVTEARVLHDRAEPPPFGAIWDLRAPLRRLEKEGSLEGATLLQIAQTLQAGSRLARFLRDRRESAPGLARLAAQISPLDGVSGPILEAIGEGGVLDDRASAELGRLRRALAEMHERLAKRMRGLMEAPHIAKHLQDHFYTQREDRYVLPVRADAGPVVQGIVHGSSASGATLFIEPQEVVGLNNELKVAEIAVVREEARILAELSAAVGEEWRAIDETLGVLERLDVVDARARLALKLSAHPPRLAERGRLNLHSMRPPLMVLAGTKVVENDLELAPGRALIISGPNAGGKTVCLKTLGLCALMVRAGMHLPAGADSEIPIYSHIGADLGDDQSIEQNLSTFTAHLSHLQHFLHRASPRSLILLDEIAVGTDPGEGAALAQALLERLTESGAQVVVTTHYERLKSLAVGDERFVNASVGLDLQQLLPTYRLHLGMPGSSGALAVARRLGLPGHVLDRATSLLDRGAQDLAALLDALGGERTRLEEQRGKLAAATREAETLAEQQRAALERARERERQSLHGAYREAIEELRRARQEIERVRTVLKRPPTRMTVEEAEKKLSAAAATIREHEPKPEVEGEPARPEDLRPGVAVLVATLGGAGEVLEAPQRGKVAVRVGGLRAQVAIEQVRLAPHTKREKERRSTPVVAPGGAPPAPPGPRTAPIRTSAITLDLRGRRVDEGLSELDKFLDSALRAAEPAIYVIHGHGTGALRAALREHLGESELVDSFHAAEAKEGGEGVTVVWLK